MKVYNSIITNQYQYKPNFKSNDNEWHVYGYDDEISKARRDYIRQDIEKYTMPYQSIYEKEGRKSKFEMKQMIADLVRKPVIVDDKKIAELNLHNLDFVGDTSYRGAMINSDKLYKVGKLYEAGIRRIIAIGRGYTALQDECKKVGMVYQAIEFDGQSDAFKTIDKVRAKALNFARDIVGLDEKESAEYINESINCWKQNSRTFIDKFTTYIQNMQKGNLFMGCDFGTYNTDTAIMFDYLFNPKMRHSNGLNSRNKTFVFHAENLYHNLTKSDKLKMGWTKDFEQTFFKRLEKLKSMIRI